jgi:hypothetical protein
VLPTVSQDRISLNSEVEGGFIEIP